MNLLVTGGAGFIGSNFIHYILEKHPDYKVINLDLLTYAGDLNNLKGLEDNPNYTFVKGDICDYDLVTKIIQEYKINAIVNFAAETHVDNSITGPDLFFITNVLGTHNLLKVAKENGNIRFHQISTDEVYGALGDEGKFSESSPYDPRSPYSASKAAADHTVRSYYHTFNLPITISNCSNNYGPRQHKEKFMPLFISNLLQDKKVPLYGTGANIRDWLFVTDHCSAIDLILHKGKIGETYLIGGDEERTNLDITKLLIDKLGKDYSLIELVEDRAGHDYRYAVDFSKIKNELAWEPSVSFEEGIDKKIEWYKNN